MLGQWLGYLNESRLWRQPVSFRGLTFLPPTLDRWVALQAYRFGLMGRRGYQKAGQESEPDALMDLVNPATV